MALPLWRDKKVKILGLVSAQRLSLAPEIPTIAEIFPGYDLGIWQSIVAPAGTPPEAVDKLNGSIRRVLALPDVREKLLAAGIEPASSATPAEFAAFIRSQADVRANPGRRHEARLSAPVIVSRVGRHARAAAKPRRRRREARRGS